MEKRGLAVQFNWMFVIIAGAIILIFFTGFALKYKDLQQERSQVEVLKTMDNILFSLQANSLATTNQLNIPIETIFNCGDIMIDDKTIENENIAISPTEVKGSSIIWYQPWRSPFRITNFYYILPLDYKIYLVYDDKTEKNVDYLLKKLPSALKNNFIKIKPNQVKDNQGKLIYFANTKIGLQVIPSSYEQGLLKLNNKQASYENFELLMSGIISKDLLEYECIKKQALRDYNNIALIYKQKATYLSTKQPQCSYTNIINLLSKLYILDNSDTLLENNKFLAGQDCLEVF